MNLKKYYSSIIVFLILLSCSSPLEVKKKSDLAPFERFFRIYETSDFQIKLLNESKKNNIVSEQQPLSEIKVDKVSFINCFKETFSTKRADNLSKKNLSIVYVKLLISNKDKIIGMKIRIARDSDITDKEIIKLSHNLSKLKIHNPNSYPVSINEQFSFIDDYLH